MKDFHPKVCYYYCFYYYMFLLLLFVIIIIVIIIIVCYPRESLLLFLFLFLDYYLILSFGTLSGKSSILLGLWNNEYFVFPRFKESLFAINQSFIFINSSFTMAKTFMIFVSSANIISWKKMEDH